MIKRAIILLVAAIIASFVLSCSQLAPVTTTTGQESKQVAELKEEVRAKEEEMRNLQQQLKEKDNEIAKLEQEIRDLRAQSAEVEPTPPPPSGVIRIKATDLQREAEANSVAAERKYEGKVLEVTGEVVKVEKGAFGLEVRLKGRETYAGVSCLSRAKDWEEQISSISKGQVVTIRGEWRMWLMFSVYLENCSLVR